MRLKIEIPSSVCSMSGVAMFQVGARKIVAFDGCGREIGRVERSKLPKDFGPMMKSGAFGMIDAFKAVQS